jgi:hypothetical protein
MQREELLATVERLNDIELDLLDRDELAAIVAASARVRGWLDAVDLRCSRRGRTLADAGEAEPAASMLANKGNRTNRDARQISRREKVAEAMPSLEDGLSAGTVSAGHLDAIANATRNASPEVRAAFAAHEDELVGFAATESIEVFTRRCRALVAELTTEFTGNDATELDRQRADSRISTWLDPETGMHHTVAALDPLRHEILWNAINRNLRRRQQRDGNARTPWNEMQVDALIDSVQGAATPPPRAAATATAKPAHAATAKPPTPSAATPATPAAATATATSAKPAAAATPASAAATATAATATPSTPAGAAPAAATPRTEPFGAAGSPPVPAPPPPSPAAGIARDLIDMIDRNVAAHGVDPYDEPPGWDDSDGPDTTADGDVSEEVLRRIEQRVPEISVLVDLATLTDGEHVDGICETEDGSALPVSTMRRLCCDAEIIRIVMGPDRVPLDMGRGARTVTRSQRRALRAMHRTCARPDCEVPFSHTKIHHVQWWTRDRGPTDIDNLLPLCERDHHLVHEGGWILTMTPDRIATWTRPDGTVHHRGSAIDRHADPRSERHPLTMDPTTSNPLGSRRPTNRPSGTSPPGASAPTLRPTGSSPPTSPLLAG